MKLKNLLVARNVEDGQTAIEALGLDPEEWEVREHLFPTLGWAFLDIVVLPPDLRGSQALAAQFTDWLRVLRLKSKTGKLTVL